MQGEVSADRQAQPVPPSSPPGGAELPPLATPAQVEAELRQEVLRLEVVAKRLGEARREYSGWRDETGTLHAGVDFQWEELLSAATRKLWAEYTDGKIERWPGEDVRVALAKEQEIDGVTGSELRKQRKALHGEIDNLESYARIVKDRIGGLQSMLAYWREESKLSGVWGQFDQHGTPEPHA